MNSHGNINDALVYDLLRQARINIYNRLIAFYDSSWQDCTDTSRSTGAYIIFYQGGPIDYGTHVTGPVSQSGAESGYNAAFTEGMSLAHFRMLINELLKKDPDIFPEESHLTILDSNSDMCMVTNGKDTNTQGTLQGECIL